MTAVFLARPRILQRPLTDAAIRSLFDYVFIIVNNFRYVRW